MKYVWKDRCFKEFHGLDGSDCSILQYLSEVIIYVEFYVVFDCIDNSG